MSDEAWVAYRAWNDRIRDVVYPELETPVPVYMDLEGHRLAALAHHAGCSEAEVPTHLAGVVAATADIGTCRVFAPHSVLFSSWLRTGSTEAPPILPLLAVFSLAAERMAHSDHMAANNYYGRLVELIGGDRETIGQSYRRVAEPFWRGLNVWLNAMGGGRGIPTATSVGHRYVGLAVSQALIREADRERLERFFVSFDLTAGADIPPRDLEPLIDAWMTQSNSAASHHLRSLWQRTALRSHLAEIAATELAQWHGRQEETSHEETRSRVVLAMLLRAFPRRSMALIPMLFLPSAATAREITLHTTSGPLAVTAEPSEQGALTLAAGTVDPASLLEGTISLEDPLSGHHKRGPKRVVVFRRNELTGLWTEIRQVLMGDEVVVLTAEPALPSVVGLLDEVARPGWFVDEETAGVPDGWSLIRQIEIFSRPARAVADLSELAVLRPLTSSQLKLSGGLKLPSPSRNLWHAGRAPEVHAIWDGGAPFDVVLKALASLEVEGEDATETELGRWPDRGRGALIVDLARNRLDDGAYAVELVPLGAKSPRARRELELRSTGSATAGWADVEEIEHGMSDPLAALGADRPERREGPLVQAVSIDRIPTSQPAALASPPTSPWWATPGRASEAAEPRHLTRLAPDSCFYTGRHREVLETGLYDPKTFRPIGRTTSGRCEECGLEKTYSTSYWSNRRKHERRTSGTREARTDLRRLAPARPPSETASWDLALDSLRFLGGGPIAALHQVARTIDASQLFVSHFVTTLESLGHIEVRRAPDTLALTTWEIGPTSVIDVGERRQLVGYWDENLVHDFTDGVRKAGRTVSRRRAAIGPSILSTDASDDEILDHIAIDGVVVAGRAGFDLTLCLPPFSAVVAALARVPVPEVAMLAAYSPATASWVPVADPSSPGAFRAGRFSRSYFFRGEAEVEAGTAIPADPFVVKHAAALLARRPLMAYDAKARELVVPLGADLPGLYHRALTLDSGAIPTKRGSNLVYGNLDGDVASMIFDLMGR